MLLESNIIFDGSEDTTAVVALDLVVQGSIRQVEDVLAL